MEDQLTTHVEELAKAERTNDIQALDGLLHEDFVGIGPLGFTLTKEQWLGRHRSGELTYSKLEFDETSVRLFEGAAIAIVRQTQTAQFKTQQIDAELRVSITFIRDADEWRVAGMQMSPISQPPTFSDASPKTTA